MEERTTFVGLDVHKDTIAVTMLPADGAAVSWQIPHEPAALRRLATRLREAAGGPVETCYEAGGSGFTLQRQLRTAGVGCTVVALADSGQTGRAHQDRSSRCAEARRAVPRAIADRGAAADGGRGKRA